ncbi:hypothetical protein LTR10_017032 [Elasticomyces elasticus]|uniref:RanBD1 domain-containing protein n=1 Tax=Exophiala sideris TaxID=1016849 RepID=A0ABR0IZ73_9EURO|nr:hypothetical protein LTR10_017032 [Elasticomyces elasticus]KAK5023041.1 hypothetical protein LTS07_009534 [Exophiala sideris]KAK5026766.1 hypothetical protein LTR13_009806 [Exophiala sideris]KAK5052419.1 hypothetical protein LTR69_009757 [Exophiala sideris]KAK5178204.1 hypothetical protein LTR44_009288 [Eurotiomycetes sp. CCFEE 6388]
MPKREADSYITKENGITANTSQGEDKPKMSTAAQLAKRKIATPKGRLGANRSQHSFNSGSAATNPFGQSTQQHSFSNTNGGTTFGASQSFPQPGPGTNAGFSFQPPSSSSFTFGTTSSTPNPFASVNGSGEAPNNQQDISMESPQKKAALGNTFGATNAGSNMNSGFSFGQPAQQQSGGTFSFGTNQEASSPVKTNGEGLFGRASKPEESTATSNPFGQPSQPAFGGFGQAASAQPQNQTSGFSFGQDTNTSTAPASASNFSFGTQSTSTAQTPLPAFSFSQSSTPQPEAPKFSFGQNTTSQAQANGASTPGGSNLFGSGNTASKPPSTTFSFGQTQQPETSKNPFSGLGASTNEGTESAKTSIGGPATSPQPLASEQRSTSPEKPASSSSEQDSQTAANPFAGLFAGSASGSPAPISKPAFSFGTTSQPPAVNAGNTDAKPSVTQPLNAFTFGAKTAQAENTATGKKAVEQEKSQNEENTSSPPKSTFSFSAPSQPASSGGLFSPAKISAGLTEKPKELFGQSSSGADTSAKPSFGGLFKPVPTDRQEQSGSSSLLFKPSDNTSESNKAASTAISAQNAPVNNLFGTSEQTKPQQARSAETTAPASTFGTATINKPSAGAGGQATGSQDKAMESTPASEPSRRQVYTKASSLIPGHLGAEQFREYDRNYRLHSLNLGLQRKIASLDPRSNDFDNIIRHYVAARDSIGASLGLFKRNVAGSKRKGDDVDDHETEPAHNKRTRSETAVQAAPSQSKPVLAAFSGGFQPQQSASATDTTMSDGTTRNTPSSQATKLFNNMIPSSSTAAKEAQPPSGFQPSSNPFAGLTAGSSATPKPSASLRGGDSDAAQPAATSTFKPVPSTTPTKSPPKLPTFEVPKFGGGNTNFMSAFGQQAQANAKKFEKDLIDKRKAEDFDSDEDDEEAFNKQLEEEARAKRAKIEAIAQGGFAPTFKPTSGSSSSKDTSKPAAVSETPKHAPGSKFTFGNSSSTASSSNPFASLASASTSGEQSQGSTDQADEPNEDKADDEEVEEDEAEDDDDPEDEALEENDEEEEEDDDNDLQAALDRGRKHASAGKSLFDRIEPNPNNKEDVTSTTEEKDETEQDETPIMQQAKNSSFPPAIWGSHIGKSTPETPAFSPMTPATGTSKSSYKPSTFTFTPTPPTTSSSPTPGASIFAGGLVRDGPVPGEGLFGSRPTTPSNAEKSSSSLSRAVLASPAGTDNTWKQGQAISFGNGDDNKKDGPSFKFTAPSPGGSSEQKPFGSLFGTPASGSKPTDTPTQLGFQFGAPASNPAPGFLGAVSHLGGGSATSSAVSSRATSPGLTDNESVATNDTEETNDDPQTSLMDSRTGEENETCLWEGRSKALMFFTAESAKNNNKMTPNDWNSMGVGLIRVLKDKSSGKTRVVFRVEPSASILINSHLIESVTYENVPSNKSGAVRGALFYKGNLTRWVFKVKTPEMGSQLSKALEDNKSA